MFLFQCTLFVCLLFLAFVHPFLSPILLGKNELDGGVGVLGGQPISPFFRHQAERMIRVPESGKFIHLSFPQRTVYPAIIFKNKAYLWLFGGALHLTC